MTARAVEMNDSLIPTPSNLTAPSPRHTGLPVSRAKSPEHTIHDRPSFAASTHMSARTPPPALSTAKPARTKTSVDNAWTVASSPVLSRQRSKHRRRIVEERVEQDGYCRGPHHDANRSRPGVDPRRGQHCAASGSCSEEYDRESLPIQGRNLGRVTRDEPPPSETRASINNHADSQGQDDDVRIRAELHYRQMPRGHYKEGELSEAREEPCKDGRTGALEHDDAPPERSIECRFWPGTRVRRAAPARGLCLSAGRSTKRQLIAASGTATTIVNAATSQGDRVPVV